MLKKITSILLGVLTLCTLAAPAMALPHYDDPADMPEMIPSRYVMVSGEVVAVDQEAGQITINLSDGSGEFVLNVDGNTAIVNNATRKAMKLSAVKEGSTIRAWHSEAVTRSLPPQSYAYAIAANVKEGATPGLFIEASDVTIDEKGNVVILNDAQDLYLTIAKGTRIPVLGKSARLSLPNIRAGERFFAWYDMVALSYPSRAAAENIVALPYAYEGSVVVKAGKAIVNGKTVAKSVEEKGEAMVPVETVAEALGFEAKAKGRDVTLTKGEDTVVFQAGNETFTFNGEEIGITAPAVRSTKLHVGLDAIAWLGNYFTAEIVR